MYKSMAAMAVYCSLFSPHGFDSTCPLCQWARDRHCKVLDQTLSRHWGQEEGEVHRLSEDSLLHCHPALE